MDKYEYRIKAEEIVKLVGKEKYGDAVRIADEIDWNRVKNVQMLCTVSDVYERNGRLDEAREILFLAYDRSPADRMIIYNIVELSIALGDLQEAVNYFREYAQLARNDVNVYVLKYKLYRAKNANVETLISVLEDLKNLDFHEEWGYELARLYAEGGYVDQCLELCDELDLWFSEGPYVMQALELKSRYVSLTPAQERKLDRYYNPVAEEPKPEFYGTESEMDAPEEPVLEQESVPVAEDVAPETVLENEEERPAREDALHEEESEERDLTESVEEADGAQESPMVSGEETSKEVVEEDMFYAGNRGAEQKTESEPETTDVQEMQNTRESEEEPSDELNVGYEEPAESADEEDAVSLEDGGAGAKRESVFRKLGRWGRHLVEPSAEYEDDFMDDYLDDDDEKISSALEEWEPFADEEDDPLPEKASEEMAEVTNSVETESAPEKPQKPEETESAPEEAQKSEETESVSEEAQKSEETESASEEVQESEEPEPASEEVQKSEETESDSEKSDRFLFLKPEKEEEEEVSDDFLSLDSEEEEDFDEAGIEDALRNLDRFVEAGNAASQAQGNDEKRKDGQSLTTEKPLEKRNTVSAETETVTPTWNGVSRYDTMNLQKELAKSIQKLLEATEMDTVDATLEDVKKLVEDSNIPELTETMRMRTVKTNMLNGWAKSQAERLKEAPEVAVNTGTSSHRERKYGRKPEVITTIKLKPTKEDRKRELEKILVQEDDGQIGLIFPDEKMVEKQITGQMNIEDVLAEWNRKSEREENARQKADLEKARQAALSETQEFMSQVMELLSQCLIRCREEDECSLKLLPKLNDIRQALNSTHDLSEISKLNIDLAELLEQLCPEEPELSEEIRTAAAGEDLEELTAEKDAQALVPEGLTLFEDEEDLELEEASEEEPTQTEEPEEASEEEPTQPEEPEEAPEEEPEGQEERPETEEASEEEPEGQEERPEPEDADASEEEPEAQEERPETEEPEEAPEEEPEGQEERLETEDADASEEEPEAQEERLETEDADASEEEPEAQEERSETEDASEEQSEDTSEEEDAVSPMEEAAATESTEDDDTVESLRRMLGIEPTQEEEEDSLEEFRKLFRQEEPEEETDHSATGEETEEKTLEPEEDQNPESETSDPEDDDIARMMGEALQGIAQEIQGEAEKATEEETPSKKDEEKTTVSSASNSDKKEKHVDPEDEDDGDEDEENDVPLQGTIALSSDGAGKLTESQKNVFSYFAEIESVASQINQVLNEDHMGNAHMIITGGDGCGKTSLALRIAKAQEEISGVTDKKVAKIKAAALNDHDLDEAFRTVEGGVLIIEKAVALSDTTLARIREKLDEGANVQIILTTKRKSVERLRARNEALMEKFKVCVDIPPYNNNELVEYGKSYAATQGYEIEDMAVLALFSRLGNLQNTKGTLAFEEVKEVIDRAVENADKRNGKLFQRLFGKNRRGRSLLEEDFQ